MSPPFGFSSLTPYVHDFWDTAFHPLWMVGSGLFTCWHAADNHPLAGLTVVFFLC